MTTTAVDAEGKLSTGIKFKTAPPRDSDDQLRERYRVVRALSAQIAAPLHPEDQVIQSMPGVSPTKWHLAHTTWFFETFILKPHASDYREFSAGFDFLFNSYYNTVGHMHARPERGLVSRPTVDEVNAYRQHVDAAMVDFLASADAGVLEEVAPVIEIGLHHEQQHQELMLTDIKHVLSRNPLFPAAYTHTGDGAGAADAVSWHSFDGGVVEIGYADRGFCFDNETPRHAVQLHPFALADRAVTNDEFAAFVDDGGYTRPELWLSDGWAKIREHDWREPLYWQKVDGAWHAFTFAGLRRLECDAPICHISYYEADAFARWAGARLPTEAEWETAAQSMPVFGHFLAAPSGAGALTAPRPLAAGAASANRLRQFYGDVWEWTQSAYGAYPGFKPLSGSLGEYNGKFMCNQLVLRGGSCLTPEGHVRASYRNFFPADARWQMSGIRLAQDAA